jgi:hypothetical protein
VKRKTIAAAAALSAAFAFGWHFTHGMGAQEAIRKLSGLRICLALYAAEHKPPPADFNEMLRSGRLDGIPYLKLRGHLGHAAVRQTPVRDIRDTGSWAYVNDPKSHDFGLVYIDSSQRDEKGRFWSEF